MSAWITFWKYACIVGLGSYFVVVLWVIPCGAWDVLKLFRDLDKAAKSPPDKERP